MHIFYEKEIKNGISYLNREESKHCAQVLRHLIGDEICILDGIGGKYNARLTSVNKNKCEFEVFSESQEDPKPSHIHLAIAPTKSMDRMEWMVEKLCEIGIDKITFLETGNSERRKIKIDRLDKKAVSALKQSKNSFKTQINDIQPFSNFISEARIENKWIAHIDPNNPHLVTQAKANEDGLILIGPEGDFTKTEIDFAIHHGFYPVSLGESTLRTETAGLLACYLLSLVSLS